ncbi:MAG: DUF1572 domain-containing protein [Chitinophagaceae bacterium]|nr:MAG: DUF1572 domain-containing protein [Chitinophagaceae bacterium]
MKELLVSYAQYNAWANEQLLPVLRPLPAAQLESQLASSFPSLRQTILHMADASSIWWQRLQLQEKILRPSDSFDGDTEALLQLVTKLDQQWLKFVQKAGEHVLTHEFIYVDLKKQSHKSVTAQVLQHLFNHNTYHRGQLVTMLRQLGVTSIPATDYIMWTRTRK